MACKLLEAYGTYFPDWGYNSGFLHWEHGVLTTGSWRKSLKIFFEVFKVSIIIFFTHLLNCFKRFSRVNTFISIFQCNQNMAADKWRVLMIEQNLSGTFLYGTFLFIIKSNFLIKNLQYFGESSLYKNIHLSLLLLYSFNILKNLILPITF